MTSTTTTKDDAEKEPTSSHPPEVNNMISPSINNEEKVEEVTNTTTEKDNTSATNNDNDNQKKKRRGDIMTKDDYERLDEVEDMTPIQSGSFQKASEEVLKQRRIFRAKRPTPVVGSISDDSKDTAANPTTEANLNNNTTSTNPFGSIQLTASTEARNPFKSIQLTASTSTVPIAATENATTTTAATTALDDKTGKNEPTPRSDNIDSVTSSPSKPLIFGASANFSGFGMASSSSSSSNGGFFGGFLSSSGGSGVGSGSSGLGTSLQKPLSFGGFGSSASSYTKLATGTTTAIADDTTTQLFAFSEVTASNPKSTDQTLPSLSSSNNHFPSVFGSVPTSNASQAESPFVIDSTSSITTTILPADYDIKSGEEDEIVLFTKRCKAFRWGPPSNNNGNNNGHLHNGESNTADTRQHSSVPPSHSSLIIPSSSTSLASRDQQQHIDEADMAASGSVYTSTNVFASSSIPQETTTSGSTTAVDADGTSAPSSANTGKCEAQRAPVYDDNKKNQEENRILSHDNNAWHELGIGPLRLLQTKENPLEGEATMTEKQKRFRLVQRRESTAGGAGTTVILNLRLSSSHTTIVSPAEKHVRISTAAAISTTATNTTTTGRDDNENSKVGLALYLFKFKLASEASEFMECVQRHVLDYNTSASCDDDDNVLRKEDE
jgi:NUP50 (Nucleoporin 50 kDa)